VKSLIAGLLMCFGSAQAAEYTFAIEPNTSPEQASEMFKPLLDYLKQSTGHSFKLVVVRNYHLYWQAVRTNKSGDFVFDDPHFTDYRIQRFKYTPLVKTAENSSFTLLSQNELPNNDVKELVGESITTMAAPSLAFALLLDVFPNPMQQPDIRTTPTSWRDTIDIVFAGEAEAAMVPNWLYMQYPNLLPVMTTRELPGPAVSASPNVPPEVQKAVTDALLKLHEQQELFDIINQIGISQFVPATALEYAGSEQVLRNFFGY